MARFRRLDVLVAMEETGLVPVFYNADLQTAIEIVRACASGGARCIEMTNRGDGASEVFKELEQYTRRELPRIILGTGSIVDAATAAIYVAHGSNFIVGPVLDAETAVFCNKRKIPYLPGCATATEIHQAESLGVEICKIFPGDLAGGPAFVKAIKAPCPWTSLMPTGGVSPDRKSLGDWFQAGVSCVGIGSSLITAELVAKKDFTTLTVKVRETLAMIKEVRQK